MYTMAQMHWACLNSVPEGHGIVTGFPLSMTMYLVLSPSTAVISHGGTSATTGLRPELCTQIDDH